MSKINTPAGYIGIQRIRGGVRLTTKKKYNGEGIWLDVTPDQALALGESLIQLGNEEKDQART